MSNTPRLLVFGGTGFLGGRLCFQAAEAGWAVDATYLSSAPPSGLPATWHRCDIVEPVAVDAVIDKVQPTHIINAAYHQREHVARVCADAPETIALQAAHSGIRLVQLSTDLVYDGTLGRRYREDDPVSPLGAYGNAKAEGEVRVRSADPSAAIIRTSLIYGDPAAPQEQLVHRAVHDGDIAFFTDEYRTAVHVDDLARATLDIARSTFSGLVHVAGTERQNRLEFASVLASALRLDVERLVGRTQDPELGPRASDVSLDTTRSASLGITLPGPTERLANGYS